MPQILGFLAILLALYLYYLLIKWMFLAVFAEFCLVVAVLGAGIAPIAYAINVYKVFLEDRFRWQSQAAPVLVYPLIGLLYINFLTFAFSLTQYLLREIGLRATLLAPVGGLINSYNQAEQTLFAPGLNFLAFLFFTKFSFFSMLLLMGLLKATLVVSLLLLGRGLENKQVDSSSEPAYLQYFFKEAFLDLRQVAEYVTKQIFVMFQEVVKWLYMVNDGPQIGLTWPLVLAAAMGLLIAALISALSVLFLLSLHGIGLAFVLAFNYTIAFLFFLFERGILHIRSGSLRTGYVKCPYAGCHEDLVQPEYACPHCGQWHQKLIPGKHGVLHRSCCCGKVKVPTLFWFGKTDLDSRCPQCKGMLQKELFGANVHLPIYGSPSAGKTMFMMAASWELIEQQPDQIVTRLIKEEQQKQYTNSWKKDFEQGRLQQKTMARLPDAFLLSASSSSGLSTSIYLYDPAGEALHNEDDLSQHSFLKYVDVFAILIDPLTLESVKEYLAEKKIQTSDSSPSATADPEEMLNQFTGALARKGILSLDKPFSKKIAVIFTKTDIPEVRQFMGLEGPKEETQSWSASGADESERIDRWMKRCEPALQHQLRLRFQNIRYFAISALGHAPSEYKPFAPSNVLAPVKWLLSKQRLLTHPRLYRAQILLLQILFICLFLSPLVGAASLFRSIYADKSTSSLSSAAQKTIGMRRQQRLKYLALKQKRKVNLHALQTANQLLRARRWKSALLALKKISQGSPQVKEVPKFKRYIARYYINRKLSRAYYQARRSRYQRAFRIFKQVLQEFPEDPHASHDRQLLLQKLRKKFKSCEKRCHRGYRKNWRLRCLRRCQVKYPHPEYRSSSYLRSSATVGAFTSCEAKCFDRGSLRSGVHCLKRCQKKYPPPHFSRVAYTRRFQVRFRNHKFESCKQSCFGRSRGKWRKRCVKRCQRRHTRFGSYYHTLSHLHHALQTQLAIEFKRCKRRCFGKSRGKWLIRCLKWCQKRHPHPKFQGRHYLSKSLLTYAVKALKECDDSCFQNALGRKRLLCLQRCPRKYYRNKASMLRTRLLLFIPERHKNKTQRRSRRRRSKGRVLKSSQIYHMVEFWRRTWKDIARSKSVSKLQSLYHRHFYHRDAKMNKRRYMARLNRGAQRTPWLSIKIRRFRILQNSPQQFTVRFLQYYRRPGLSDVGYKTLIWRKDGHYWRIYREYWKGR